MSYCVRCWLRARTIVVSTRLKRCIAIPVPHDHFALDNSGPPPSRGPSLDVRFEPASLLFKIGQTSRVIELLLEAAGTGAERVEASALCYRAELTPDEPAEVSCRGER